MTKLFGLIEDIQKKPKEVRMKVFIGIMILSSVVVITIFGLSVKYALQESNADNVNSMDNDISNRIPSIMESIKSSIVEVFQFKEEVENNINSIENKGSVNAEGGRLPRAR